MPFRLIKGFIGIFYFWITEENLYFFGLNFFLGGVNIVIFVALNPFLGGHKLGRKSLIETLIFFF